MTDLERFLSLYESFGLNLIPERSANSGYTYVAIGRPRDYIACPEDIRIGGYSGCYTEVIFDSNGSFLAQNAWE